MSIFTVPLNDTLHVHVCDSDDPHILIERRDAGLVRIEESEIERLADVLTLAVGADLAALGKLVGPAEYRPHIFSELNELREQLAECQYNNDRLLERLRELKRGSGSADRGARAVDDTSGERS